MRMIFKSFLLLICSTVLPAVNGCGLIPAGRERTLNFTVSGFKIPPIMAFSVNPAARMKAATISTSRSDAVGFVQRLIMGHVKDVLYEQGRSAFLTDSVISSILQQLTVQINYDPLKCDNVIDLMGMAGIGMMMNCVVTDGIVANICTGGNMDACMDMAMTLTNSKPIDPKHFSISGGIKTSNAVMASWSNQMWENVLNRVLRRIASGQYAAYFFGASINIR